MFLMWGAHGIYGQVLLLGDAFRSATMNGYSGILYAVRMAIPIMGTLGGVKVNERLEALDVNESPIPGPYVSGQEGSGFYSYPYYATKCSTSTYAYTSGRLAGLLNAAAYVETV